MPRTPIILRAAIEVTFVFAIAACGSATQPSATASASRQFAQWIRYSSCMRVHGVPNFPDPSHGGGFQIPDSDINSPAFKTPHSACAKLLPGTPATGCTSPPSTCPTGHAFAMQSAMLRTSMLKASRCMRHHGVPDFPDPTATLPSNRSGYSRIDDRDGVILAIPNTINMQAPAFSRAWITCMVSKPNRLG